MDICIISTVHNLFDTRIFNKGAKSLRKAGYNVFLLGKHDKREEIEGIKIIPLNPPKGLVKRVFYSIFHLNKLLKTLDAKVFHLHDPELIFLGFILKVKGKKVIYDVHEDTAEQIKTKSNLRFRSLLGLIYKFFERILTKSFYFILAEDSYEKKYSTRKKEIVRNFPRLESFPEVKKSKKTNNVMGYVGRVSKIRGIENNIEAIKLLQEENYLIKFVCIGEIKEGFLAELEEKYGKILENVQFLGRKKTEDAYKILAQESDFGIVTIFPTKNYINSYPTKLFEYMALELPVICSDFPLYRSVVENEDCGLLVNPLNVREICEAIKFLLNNPEEAKRKGKNGRKAVEQKYNWKNEEKKLLEFYSRILQEKI